MSDWQFTEQHYDLLLTKITEIETQVRTANGRVRKLETWRSYLTGAWAATVVLWGLYTYIKGGG